MLLDPIQCLCLVPFIHSAAVTLLAGGGMWKKVEALAPCVRFSLFSHPRIRS